MTTFGFQFQHGGTSFADPPVR